MDAVHAEGLRLLAVRWAHAIARVSPKMLRSEDGIFFFILGDYNLSYFHKSMSLREHG